VHPITVTARNYRCFGDAQALRLTIDRGFTALVGPNDAGKSAVLKLFHELRPVWVHLANAHVWASQPFPNYAGGLHGITDAREIFHDANGRDIVITVESNHEPQPKAIEAVEIRINRPKSMGGVESTTRVVSLNNVAGTPLGMPSRLTDVGDKPIEGHSEPIRTTFEILRDAMFLPAFRNGINVGGAAHYDIDVGTQFIQSFSNWKGGDDKEHRATIIRLTARIAELLGFESLEINPSHAAQKIVLNVNGRPRELNEVGSGISQFILTLVSVAIRRPSIVLIDEPELNLHPTRQVDLLQALTSLTGAGAIVFATHSMGLARSVAEKIYTVLRGKGKAFSEMKVLGDPSTGLELVGEMSYSLQAAVGVEGILFVEGVTDVMPLRRFLRLYGKEHRVLVIPMRGGADLHANRRPDWEELRRLQVKIFALIDSERANAGAPLHQIRQDFLAMMSSLGYAAKALDRRAIENYFPDHATSAAFPGSSALDEYDNPKGGGWAKADNWQIAEYVTKADLIGTDLGEWLEALFQ
jgi:ABC-type branched-subunit amino acid transport system ATPase component